MAKFIIDRKKWLRGEGDGTSYLYRVDDGLMCCLGQVGDQCGIEIEDMKEKEVPLGVKNCTPFPKWFFNTEGYTSRDSMLAMSVNDDPSLSDEDRESMLIMVFKKHGDELEFIG